MDELAAGPVSVGDKKVSAMEDFVDRLKDAIKESGAGAGIAGLWQFYEALPPFIQEGRVDIAVRAHVKEKASAEAIVAAERAHQQRTAAAERRVDDLQRKLAAIELGVSRVAPAAPAPAGRALAAAQRRARLRPPPPPPLRQPPRAAAPASRPEPTCRRRACWRRCAGRCSVATRTPPQASSFTERTWRDGRRRTGTSMARSYSCGPGATLSRPASSRRERGAGGGGAPVVGWRGGGFWRRAAALGPAVVRKPGRFGSTGSSSCTFHNAPELKLIDLYSLDPRECDATTRPFLHWWCAGGRDGSGVLCEDEEAVGGGEYSRANEEAKDGGRVDRELVMAVGGDGDEADCAVQPADAHEIRAVDTDAPTISTPHADDEQTGMHAAFTGADTYADAPARRVTELHDTYNLDTDTFREDERFEGVETEGFATALEEIAAAGEYEESEDGRTGTSTGRAAKDETGVAWPTEVGPRATVPGAVSYANAPARRVLFDVLPQWSAVNTISEAPHPESIFTRATDPFNPKRVEAIQALV
ncbi:hypothetical protein C8J57DRAFT_1245349 [Mycena rebaudengoi]|nr:hypothetical protein C8J57DRAFT_1245349 [Mycena rebaudengoi]